MKLGELLINQRMTIQLLWGEQKIEFFSSVIEKDGSVVYVSPYVHNGNELELNIVQGKGVVCNVFTNNPSTKHRISWKNVELTTVIRNKRTLYCLKTYGYNHNAKHDDRRLHERVVIHQKAKVFDGNPGDGVDVIVHDISDIGISFFAPNTFAPESNRLNVIIPEARSEKKFDLSVECVIARITKVSGNTFVGCRISKENKDYQVYCFMKRLSSKNKTEETSSDNNNPTESNNSSENNNPS